MCIRDRNTTAQVNSRLKIGANINAHYQIYNEPVVGVANLVEMTYKAQAFHPTYTADGRYADTFILSLIHISGRVTCLCSP